MTFYKISIKISFLYCINSLSIVKRHIENIIISRDQ